MTSILAASINRIYVAEKHLCEGTHLTLMRKELVENTLVT